MQTSADNEWMAQAIAQAQRAAAAGEVPVGAVVVRDGVLLGAGCNGPIEHNDPTAHAEIEALRAAARAVGNYRLPGTTLYVTIEPCTMCIGAIMHARVERVVFGAREPRAGAVVSAARLLDADYFNHRATFTEGVLAAECGELLTTFFRARRELRNARD
ncbi:MAG: tRNA adenosine(34) deaminase TadA [Spongiibacteraceae bacterium]|jgi:tRNA(adenine34) deaminase|nr:tRNA adenosine(34) deaminase TadA [Spongiibacteraceae bacterium]